ncbi:M1 family metallopeptidase [candidate division KSB1 bacterium]
MNKTHATVDKRQFSYEPLGASRSMWMNGLIRQILSHVVVKPLNYIYLVSENWIETESYALFRYHLLLTGNSMRNNSIIYLSVVGLLLFLSADVVGFQVQQSPRNANYTINVILDADRKQLIGSERISWRNISTVSTSELHFHLYWNAFMSNSTSLARENGGMLPGNPEMEEDFGFTEITKLSILNGPEITSSIQFISPDDGNIQDRTVCKVMLPGQVAPGETIELELEFRAKIPRVLLRAGYAREFVFAAQWFPKIGVFESGSWNCHQYHLNSEFYADYGVYNVNITVPNDYIVGATGELINKVRNPNTTTFTYFQEDVHDFAWVADTQFIEFTGTFEHDSLSNVHLTLLIQPDHEAQAERHLNAAKAALKYYGEWYGEYPYSTLTIVDAPYDADAANGMEYPTLITAGTSWIAPAKYLQPESVIVHEFGHQYWYGLVGNNEFEEPWLDEGITSYVQAKILKEHFGSNVRLFKVGGVPFYGETFYVIDDIPLIAYWGVIQVDSRLRRLRNYLNLPNADPIRSSSWEVLNSLSYSNAAYNKPALMLGTLENLIGEEMMRTVLMTYLQNWKFDHPSSSDFIDNFNQVTGENWNWFFDQVLSGTGVIDYTVSEIENRKITSEDDQTGGNFDIDAVDQGIFETIASSVVLRRLGDVILPVEVKVVFEDGEVLNEIWDGRDRWMIYSFSRTAGIEYVEVDPEHKILLDVNYTNNSLKSDSSSAGAVRWTNKILFWMQSLLHIFSYFI